MHVLDVLNVPEVQVAIKSVELSIIDKAYEMGWMVPSPPKVRTDKRLGSMRHVAASGFFAVVFAIISHQRSATLHISRCQGRRGGLGAM